MCPALPIIAAAYARQAPLLDSGWLEELLAAKGVKLPRGTVEHSPETPTESHFFWGASGAIAYPLHRDISDADNFMQVLSGCKEVVVLWEDAAMIGGDVLGSRIPGTNAFSFNPFDAPSELTGAPRNDWHGEYRTGDLLFLPGNSLHHVRNRCANTVAINVRPWPHSRSRARRLDYTDCPFPSPRETAMHVIDICSVLWSPHVRSW